MSENEIKRDRGVDPAAAAADVRALLAATGESQGVIAQCRALDQWAKQSGRFLEPTPVLTEARIGGLEHRVWSAQFCGVVRKATYGGSGGGRWPRRSASAFAVAKDYGVTGRRQGTVGGRGCAGRKPSV